jgi:hypothetical protein
MLQALSELMKRAVMESNELQAVNRMRAKERMADAFRYGQRAIAGKQLVRGVLHCVHGLQLCFCCLCSCHLQARRPCPHRWSCTDLSVISQTGLAVLLQPKQAVQCVLRHSEKLSERVLALAPKAQEVE